METTGDWRGSTPRSMAREQSVSRRRKASRALDSTVEHPRRVSWFVLCGQVGAADHQEEAGPGEPPRVRGGGGHQDLPPRGLHRLGQGRHPRGRPHRPGQRPFLAATLGPTTETCVTAPLRGPLENKSGGVRGCKTRGSRTPVLGDAGDTSVTEAVRP